MVRKRFAGALKSVALRQEVEQEQRIEDVT